VLGAAGGDADGVSDGVLAGADGALADGALACGVLAGGALTGGALVPQAASESAIAATTKIIESLFHVFFIFLPS